MLASEKCTMVTIIIDDNPFVGWENGIKLNVSTDRLGVNLAG